MKNVSNFKKYLGLKDMLMGLNEIKLRLSNIIIDEVIIHHRLFL